MKKITATLIYPLYHVEVEVENNATQQDITNALFIKGNKFLGEQNTTPIIQDCSVPEINDENIGAENNTVCEYCKVIPCDCGFDITPPRNIENRTTCTQKDHDDAEWDAGQPNICDRCDKPRNLGESK